MTTAKIFQNGKSQAVRLPKEFRFEGKEVRISRVGNGVLLKPVKKKSLNKPAQLLSLTGRSEFVA